MTYKKVREELPKDKQRVFLKVNGLESECEFSTGLFGWNFRALYGGGHIVLRKKDKAAESAEWREV